jgi:REP-associated tyrosine transposase
MDSPVKRFRKTCRRYDVPGDAHCLTFSCYRRQPFLTGRRACCWLIEAIDSARNTVGFDLWAYVFMPEHVHLVLWPHKGVPISKILKEIKQPVAVAALRYVKAHAPTFLERMADVQPSGRRSHRFWQRGGGYDRNLRSTGDVHEKIAYVHANPVRCGLVKHPRDWAWSSWRAWQEGGDEPLRIDRLSLPAKVQ